MARPLSKVCRCLALLTAAAAGAGCTGTITDPTPVGPTTNDAHGVGGSGGVTAPEQGGSGGATTPPEQGGSGGVGVPPEDVTPDGVGWATRFPKLSNEQWENTVSDLFYLAAPTRLAEAFLPEPADGGYPSEAAATVTIAGDAWTRYQLAAEAVAELILGNAQNLDELVPAGAPSTLPEKARATLEKLGRRAYRRPLTPDEVDGYMALFDTGAALEESNPFAGGMRQVISTMLQSPYFLYRVESSSKADGEQLWLSGFEVATRLSYALWNSMPSDALLDAAAAHELDVPAGVKKWAETLLSDPRAATTLRLFHEQTYHTRAYGTQSKDDRFGFDAAALAPTLQEEARLFFDEVVAEGGGIASILTKPVAFVNAETAPFYGLTGMSGAALERVSLDPAERAGLLTQLGFLSQTGARSLTDPVHRGLAVLKQVLCDDPDPPPAVNIQTPAVPSGMTTRATYEQATACGPGCHDTLINPPGFAFEHFDTVGRWRADEGGLPIDTAATFGVRVGWTQEAKRDNPAILVEFDGAVDLLNQLAKQQRTHECYARRLLEFALAKPVDPEERGVGTLLGEISRTGGSAKAILAELVSLNTFRARAADPL
jgi:hypothetical protein